MSDGRVTNPVEKELSDEQLEPIDKSIFASGPIVGRLRKRVVKHEGFLDDCAYGIAQIAANFGPAKIQARDDLRVSAYIARGENAGAKGSTLSTMCTYLYGALFAMICGFVLGAFLVVPAIIIGRPKVSVLDDASFALNYSSPLVWSMSGNLDVEVLFTSHAFVPIQFYIPGGVILGHYSITRMLQQFDSAVMLKSSQTREGDEDTHTLRDGDAYTLKGGETPSPGQSEGPSVGDGDTHTLGEDGTRLSQGRDVIQYNNQSGGDMHDHAGEPEYVVDSELVSTKAAEVQTDRVEDGHQTLPMDDLLSEENDHASLSVQDVITLARVKPLGNLKGSSGRCIGKLILASDSVANLTPTILRGSKSLSFRLHIDLSAGDDCRADSTAETNHSTKKVTSMSSPDDDSVVSVKSLHESCQDFSGLLLAVEFIGLRGYTTVTMSQLDGRMTPWVYISCQSRGS